MRSRDEQPVRVRGSQSMDETSCSSAITGQPLIIKGVRQKKGKGYIPQAAGCYIMPMEYSATSEDAVVRHTYLDSAVLELLSRASPCGRHQLAVTYGKPAGMSY